MNQKKSLASVLESAMKKASDISSKRAIDLRKRLKAEIGKFQPGDLIKANQARLKKIRDRTDGRKRSSNEASNPRT